jgi:dienelactone hydrolase
LARGFGQFVPFDIVRLVAPVICEEHHMPKRSWLLALVALAGIGNVASAQAAIKTQAVEYKQGDTVLEGFLAWDDAQQGKRPGVLVVHEWDGLGDYIKMRAEMLAKLGYVAFAPDIYGKGVRPANMQQSAQESSKYAKDRSLMRQRVEAGLEQLKSNPLVDTTRIAAIGYCFGGTTALELGRSGADIAGIVTFHAGLSNPSPDDAKNIKARVLVLQGANDPYAKPADVDKFEDEMRATKVDWQFVSYGGAVHGFSNPKNHDPEHGLVYDEKVDQRSWKAMQDFFAEIFAKK